MDEKTAMTIISHVQDGLEMTREYGLPYRDNRLGTFDIIHCITCP